MLHKNRIFDGRGLFGVNPASTPGFWSETVDRPLIVLLRGPLLTPIHVLKLASLRITIQYSDNTVLIFLEPYGHVSTID